MYLHKLLILGARELLYQEWEKFNALQIILELEKLI